MITFSQKRFFINKKHSIEEKCPEILKMKEYPQHGNTSTYKHCEVVSYLCYKYVIEHNLNVDMDALIRGSLLHDFYLYDWHSPTGHHKLHGFSHPRVAMENAKKYFPDLSDKEANMIRSHMWPLTLLHIPTSKEAAILAMTDKYCSTMETFKLNNPNKNHKL